VSRDVLAGERTRSVHVRHRLSCPNIQDGVGRVSRDLACGDCTQRLVVGSQVSAESGREVSINIDLDQLLHLEPTYREWCCDRLYSGWLLVVVAVVFVAVELVVRTQVQKGTRQ
jgi:hypothetical protein